MRALISDVSGPDGSYLSQFLLNRGYEVHGLLPAELEDSGSLAARLSILRPDEVYCLAGDPDATLLLLEAIRNSGLRCRTAVASSSDIYGSAPAPQSERTAFHPEHPEARARLFAHHAAVNYRESYGMHVCCGILFHHDSPRSKESSAARAITRAVARIKFGLDSSLSLENLDLRRDWGYTPDYVRALWLMLQHGVAAGYVIGTGESHTVRAFAEAAFAYAGLNWRRYVSAGPHLCAPRDSGHLRADPAKARRYLGWAPSVGFEHLVRLMVEADVAELRHSLSPRPACAGAACG